MKDWVVLMAALATLSAAAGTGVSAEAVDKYCNANGTGCSSIICIDEADNYRNGLLTAPGTIFTAGVRYTGKSVYDTDFVDPEKTGHSYDNDTYNFDRAGNGTAYVCLHGTCNDTTTQFCTASSQCNSPPGGLSGPGTCISAGPPWGAWGWCAYNGDRYLITTADAYGNHYGGWINYSNGNVRWGESSTVGNWAGAGTNGGNNFGLLSNSCGTRPGYWYQQLAPLFSGMTVLGIIMPVTPQGADDVDAPARGTALANAYRTNPNGSVGFAWADSIVGIPQNDGGDCPNLGGSYSYGGGFGITGCGAQMTYSVDSTSGYAVWNRDTETWNQITGDTYDSAGNNYWAARWHCNYDCNAFPFTL